MADRRAQLEALVAARREGGRSKTYRSATEDLYDIVTEEEYKGVVKRRLDDADFIEDDLEGQSGYVDNGEEEDFRDDYSDEEQERSKRRDKKKQADGDATAKPARAPPKKKAYDPTLNPYKPKLQDVDSDAFMSSLLDGVGTDLKGAAPKSLARPASGSSLSTLSRKRRKAEPEDLSAALSSARFSSFATAAAASSSSLDPSSEPGQLLTSSDGMDATAWASTGVNVKAEEDSTGGFEMEVDYSMPEAPVGQAVEEEAEDLVIKPLALAQGGPARVARPPRQLVNVAATKLNKAKAEPTTELPKALPKGMDWMKATEGIAVSADLLGELPAEEDLITPTIRGAKAKAAAAAAAASAPVTSRVDAFEDDRSVRFFWLDYKESNGVVSFIGKVLDRKTGAHVSACVTVKGIERNLYVLPRPKWAGRTQESLDAEAEGTADPDVLQAEIEEEQALHDEVHEDIEALCKLNDISDISSKTVTRDYAFEVKDVPIGKARWLKVKYPFQYDALPLDSKGRTFSRIFGTNTSAFEIFVIKRKIKGPCWLRICDSYLTRTATSNCKFEITVDDPKEVNILDDAPDAPPLNIMSLSLRTILNVVDNKREIICATARIWPNVNIDSNEPLERQTSTCQTFVRPLIKDFPDGFESWAQTTVSDPKARSKVYTFKSETAVFPETLLLKRLIAEICRSDPDVIVGHDFSGTTLDVLLHRLRDLKVQTWAHVGRFKRDPKEGIKLRQTIFNNNTEYLTGRMLCDLSSEGSKSMITSVTWSLTEMCLTHLKVDREEIDPEDTANYFDATTGTPDHLVRFVRHCEADAYFQMALANKVQLLPLTRQLTNLAGNSWNKTLQGGRAERNEYILLHKFHSQKYICPDKLNRSQREAAKKRAAQEAAEDNDGEAESGKKATKKDKYKGGLVFDPKRGLWDKFILVMDFNSLYPSIIQEYNIDFTTVDRAGKDYEELDRIPDVPSSDLAQGVLPQLIATFVSRRKAVKGMMKSATPNEKMQLNIKQLALKLTANSMYGCLGFEGSRFYARPLAALTTSKGREILTNTKELAESLQLEVIYGDTDSVMINTNASDLGGALKIGNDFKKLVNDKYRLLEIDIDAVFQRMLLLQKKKYAALKVDNFETGEASTEIKGLDMKRREYCDLSKNVSSYVLKQILSGQSTEVVVESIHEYLETVGKGVRNGDVQLDDFIVHKRLGKNPKDYPDSKSLPHVQVAVRMKANGGREYKAGDVVPYIFCVGENGQTAKTAQADKAHHPDEVRRQGSTLKIDYEHYLSLQVLPPVERLCDAIEGTERARLAECLGLDMNRYRAHTMTAPTEREFHTLESQISDAERFRESEPLRIACRHCQHEVAFGGLQDDKASLVQPWGLTCPNAECGKPIGVPSVVTQLDVQLRAVIGKLYAAWLVCDDQSCKNRTRMMSVFGKRCLRPDCRGSMHYEYSDSKLYTQLLYFESLFDAARLTSAPPSVQSLAASNEALLRAGRVCVQRYLDRCGRRYVQLSSLFSFVA